MPDRPLLVTTTGEPFQPARLHYSVRDRRGLEACMRELECVSFDKGRNRWVWLFDAEARSLKFERSWKDVSKNGPVVLGSFYFRATSAAELYVRSIERALMAVTFFDQYVPRTVARITDMDVANRLFSADQRDLTPETIFADAETDSLRQQVEERRGSAGQSGADDGRFPPAAPTANESHSRSLSDFPRTSTRTASSR